MDIEIPTYIWCLVIVGLLFCSGFFSGSETAMMKLNPYRLRHKVREGHLAARKANKLLRRQDRLLAVILIGNNLVNICAATIATMICVRWFGELGYAVATFGLTLLILIFAEVAPKTIAASRPETIAFPATFVLDPLHTILHPVVEFVNFFSRWIVKPLVSRTTDPGTALTSGELRTAVRENPGIQAREQGMLLGILDLADKKIDEIMIPRSDVVGIDLNDADADIIENLKQARHTRLPVFRDSIDNVVGILHLRKSGRLLNPDEFERQQLLANMDEPYFVPSKTPLSTQLINFQNKRERIALIVDEYGDVEGILTLEGILEAIVGDFTTGYASTYEEIFDVEKDGSSALIIGSALLRDINRELSWNLPTDGPRTLNGLVLEQLEGFPDGNVSIKVNNYILETRQVRGNAIRSVRVTKLEEEPATEEHPEDADSPPVD